MVPGMPAIISAVLLGFATCLSEATVASVAIAIGVCAGGGLLGGAVAEVVADAWAANVQAGAVLTADQ
jgi:hypothetical protein